MNFLTSRKLYHCHVTAYCREEHLPRQGKALDFLNYPAFCKNHSPLLVRENEEIWDIEKSRP